MPTRINAQSGTPEIADSDPGSVASPDDIAFAQGLRAFYRSMNPLAGSPDPVDCVRDMEIPASNPDRIIPARLYVPLGASDTGSLPVIVFMHGGGYVSGDFDTHDVMVRALANRSQALVLAVGWRLAPEHPFPAGLEDGIAAVEWAAAEAARIGADPERIALCGDSAGGSVAASVAIALRDRKGPRVVAQVLFYPSVGNGRETPSWQAYGEGGFPSIEMHARVLALYVGNDLSKLEDPLVAPLLADLQNLPSTFVVTAGHDPLKDEGRTFAEKIVAAGGNASVKEYPEAAHALVQFFKDKEGNPLGEQALDDGVAFLREQFHTA